MSEIHEQIQSTNPDYTNFLNYKRSENEDSTVAAASSAAPTGAYVRPLPIAALMGDVNSITVPEPDVLELAEDVDGGENTYFLISVLKRNTSKRG